MEDINRPLIKTVKEQTEDPTDGTYMALAIKENAPEAHMEDRL